MQRVLVRTIEQCKKLPESFIKERAEVTNGGSVVRRNAKKENNFALFEPYLTKIIDLCLQKAELLGYTDHPYDAMLDDYEEGLTTKQVEAYFTELK
ncbi:hypothetical protein KBC03_08240 [Patescibacteria group bacterium]|nr:hypothetical protein [Patescibacteria group bacterium]